MINQLLHTPDGVRDLYGDECERKLLLEERIRHVFHTFGYQDIETPSYEFFDIFNKERGSVQSRKMFKFFDRENNTMVLRPDFTPGIARCAAKYYSKEEASVRLCYTGDTFINNSSYQGRLAEATQAGCELIGNTSVEADAEMIALLIDSLLCTGLSEFQVELGHVGFYEGLVKEAGLSAEAGSSLKTIIRNKNLFLIDDLLKENGVSDAMQKAFYELPQAFGGVEVLDKAISLTSNTMAVESIRHLQRVYELLKAYGVEKYVSFDLGVMSELNYYTGIIFRAYTFDVGEPIANGGRYDHLIAQFGSDKPSIGLGINVDLLAQALSRQQIDLPLSSKGILVIYDKDPADAIAIAGFYRKADVPAVIVSQNEAQALNQGQYEEVIIANRANRERIGC